jgi:hypothetical protein
MQSALWTNCFRGLGAQDLLCDDLPCVFDAIENIDCVGAQMLTELADRMGNQGVHPWY